MSKARLSYDALVRIETLKRVAWTRLIDTRLKIIERRERDIITTIFQALTDNLAMSYCLTICKELEAALIDDEDDVNTRKRVVCDFIAGMSDRYAEASTRLKTNLIRFFCPLAFVEYQNGSPRHRQASTRWHARDAIGRNLSVLLVGTILPPTHHSGLPSSSTAGCATSRTEFRLVGEALAEREVLLRVAPT